MKNVFLITFIFLSLVSCSQKKSGTKSSFKIVLGASALSVPMTGGAFVETENLTSNIKNIVKLDAENSAFIPNGSYNLQFIAFTGPSEKSGIMYCGIVNNASLLTASATIAVTLTQASCSDAIYTEFKNKLLGNSNWDSATFDNSKWGP